MKVAFVTSEFPPDNPGGAGISSKLIAESLRNSGVDITVFALTGDRKTRKFEDDWIYQLPKDELYPGPKTIGENISSYFHLPELHQFDLVHVYNTRHLPACILRNSPPIVATINNHTWICVDPIEHFREGMPRYGFWRAFREAKSAGYTGVSRVPRAGFDYFGKKLVKRTDQFTVQTVGMKQAMMSAGYSPDKVNIVPNILDPNFEVESSGSEKSIMFVGQLYPNKAPDLVVKSFVNLPEDILDEWTLKIFGSGPLRGMLDDIIDRNRAADIQIRYVPYTDLPQEYSNAELLIHSSQYVEPFSRTWLEAMASGTPILCSQNPSSTAILNEIAKFYQPFNQKDLEEKLKSILESHESRQRMRERGKRALEKYRPSAVAEKYIETYQTMI